MVNNQCLRMEAPHTTAVLVSEG